MKNVLENIVGDELRVKLMRLFYFHIEQVFLVEEIAKAVRKNKPQITNVLKYLVEDGILIRKKKSVPNKSGKGKKEVSGYGFNKKYKHKEFLGKLLVETSPTGKELLINKLFKVPGVKVIISTGSIIGPSNAKVDLLVASEKEAEKELISIVRESEKILGKELKCSFLTPNDLAHRIQVNDKFIRDILDNEREVHLDRLGIVE